MFLLVDHMISRGNFVANEYFCLLLLIWNTEVGSDRASPRIQAVYGLRYFDGSFKFTAWEILCVEVVDNVCTRAYMQCYLI